MFRRDTLNHPINVNPDIRRRLFLLWLQIKHSCLSDTQYCMARPCFTLLITKSCGSKCQTKAFCFCMKKVKSAGYKKDPEPL